MSKPDENKDAWERLVVLKELDRDSSFKPGYDYKTDLKLALRKRDEPVTTVTNRSAKNTKPLVLSTAEYIEELSKKADIIVADTSIPTTHRLIHLRNVATGFPTSFKDAELQRLLWDARRRLAPGAKPIGQGGKLSRRQAPWLWDGILIKSTTNLVVALPKVGKSRLISQVIGRLAKGEDEFLGRKLFGPCPPVLIVGTDQPEPDWAECLGLAGLLDADGAMHSCIKELYHTGCPLHLDEDGIDRITELCRQYPGMLVLVDSYAKCTNNLGIVESDSQYAGPLMDLQEATAPYGATLVVIHHSNRNSAGGRASMSSRGTTALPAAVSQTISLTWANADDANPLAKRDGRVKLNTEGRGGKPQDLLIEQIEDGHDWLLHGTGEEIAVQSALEKLIEALTDRQYAALRDMAHHYNATGCGMDARHLADALDLSPHGRVKAQEVLDSLNRKKLIEPAGNRPALGSDGGKPANLYRPVDAVLPLFALSASIPFKPSIDNVTVTKTKEGIEDMKGDSLYREVMFTCECCGKEFAANKKGRAKKYCSETCRVRAYRDRKSRNAA